VLQARRPTELERLRGGLAHVLAELEALRARLA
jgi:hypothetical protein